MAIRPVNKDMRILVVDDFGPVRKVTEDMLKKLGFQNIISATDGNSAIEKMRSERVDLILSNWNMKPMDGLSLLKVVRSNQATKNIPVILTTAKSKPESIIEAKKYGVNNYIVRPFSAATLKSRLESIKYFTPATKKRDNLFKMKKMLAPIMVCISSLRTVEKVLPIAGEQVEYATAEMYKHFSTLTKYISKTDATPPPEVAAAISKILSGLQFQDRNSQFMQNAEHILQHSVGLLKDIKATIHELGDYGTHDKNDSNILVRKILSDIRLTEISVIFKNMLFGNGVIFETEAEPPPAPIAKTEEEEEIVLF